MADGHARSPSLLSGGRRSRDAHAVDTPECTIRLRLPAHLLASGVRIGTLARGLQGLSDSLGKTLRRDQLNSENWKDYQRLERLWIGWLAKSCLDPSDLLGEMQAAAARCAADANLVSAIHVLTAGVHREVGNRDGEIEHLRSAIALSTVDNASRVEMHWQLLDALIENYQPFAAIGVVRELMRVENRRAFMAAMIPKVVLVALAHGDEHEEAVLGALSYYEAQLELTQERPRAPLARAERIRLAYLEQRAEGPVREAE